MARAALGEALLRRGALRRLLFSQPPAAAASSRSFHAGDGESAEDFEKRLFADDGPNTGSFYRKLDKIEKAHGRSSMGPRLGNTGNSQFMEGLTESFDSLNDGMDEKLDQAARTFVYADEMEDEDYAFRPDATFMPGTTYNVRDLDLTKPAASKITPREVFETTTEEVLRKADFRNVRFLSNFLTEAGIIKKRSQTRISAKAQRKVAREIKTARAFGLMPFTTMGTKPFIFGRSMRDLEEDYEYDDYDESNAPGGAAAEPDDDIV